MVTPWFTNLTVSSLMSAPITDHLKRQSEETFNVTEQQQYELQYKGKGKALLPTPIYTWELGGEREGKNSLLKLLSLTMYITVGLFYYTYLKLAPLLGYTDILNLTIKELRLCLKHDMH